MKKDLPLEAQDQLIAIVMDMHEDYDNGLREFQEAINYAIYHIAISKSKNTSRKESVKQLLYLRDLIRRLKQLECIVAIDC